MTKLEEKVLRLAIAWWKRHRPVVFSEREHIDNPGINCTGSCSDRELAIAVGALVAARRSERNAARRVRR